MAPRRAKSGAGSATGQRWEQALLSTAFHEEEKWRASIHLVVGSLREDYFHINELTAAVNTGVRRKFSVIRKEELLEQVIELGNPKSKKPKEVPLFSEVCEPCKMYLDNEEDIPLPLLAKLLKFKLLDVKQKYIKQCEMEKKTGSAKAVEKGKKGDKKDRSKSPSKAKGKKTPEPPSPKTGSKLRRRGDEDTEGKYIDDEPEEGPQHYVLIVGFHHPHLLFVLNDININVDSIIKIESEDYSRFHPAPPDIDPAEIPGAESKDEKTLAAEEVARKKEAKLEEELESFWKDVLLLLRQPEDESKLHDVARLVYTVQDAIVPDAEEEAPEKKAEFGANMFESISGMLYDLLDAKRQWRTYIDNLKLIVVPTQADLAGAVHEGYSQHSTTPAPAAVTATVTTDPPDVPDVKPLSADVDMRYYDDLMSNVPLEYVTVPLVMHCMLEQIEATEVQKDPPSEVPKVSRPDGLDEDLAAHISRLAYKLALTPQEQQELGLISSQVANNTNTQDPEQLLEEAIDRPEPRTDLVKDPQLISYRDEMAQRMHLLKATDGLDPWKAEMTALKKLGFEERLQIEATSSKTKTEKAAHLQELLHFCAPGGFTTTEIEHAFKQFVMECMELTKVDDDNRVTRPTEGLACIPWDLPHAYFTGQTSGEAEEDEKEAVDIEDIQTEVEASKAGTPSPPLQADKMSEESASTPTDDKPRRPRSRQRSKKSSPKSQPTSPPAEPTTTPEVEPVSSRASSGILRTDKSRSRSPASRNSSVHFECEGDQEKRSDPVDEADVDATADVLDLEQQSVDEKVQTMLDSRQRNLDQWCFAEHLESAVLLQVLNEAMYSLPYMDTYHHQRDNSLLVALHSPYNSQLLREEDWFASVHSNCGFRNYLEHVSKSIEDWTREQEALYRAGLLAKEVEGIQKDAETSTASRPGTGKGKGKDRAKSPKKTGSRTRSSSRGSSSERPVSANPFVRAGTLKALKEEQDRLRAEEEEKERLKAEKRAKSPQKDKEAKDDKKRPQSRTSSKSRLSKEQEPVQEVAEPIEEEPNWPFIGYNVGNHMLHASGTQCYLFPQDGGQIHAERIEFLHDKIAVKAAVLKDGHEFLVHVINPKQDPYDSSEQKTEKLESSSNEEANAEEKDTIPTPANVVKEDNDDAQVPYEDKATTEEAKPPAVGSYGSFLAKFNDGLNLSFSVYGKSGESEDGKPYEPTVYVLPRPVSPPPVVKESPSKGKGKDKVKAALPTPEPVQITQEDETKTEVTSENPGIKQAFQELTVSCPDGLSIKYMLESALGVIPGDETDKKLAVKQSYEYKTRGEQITEQSRQVPMQEHSRVILSIGAVIKFMTDNSVEVLYADGKVSRFNDITQWQAPVDRLDSPQRTNSARSQVFVEREQTPAKEKDAKKKKVPTATLR